MKRTFNVPVRVAAKLLNVSRRQVQVGIQRGIIPIGYAYHGSEHAKRHSYCIPVGRLAAYLHISVGDVLEAMDVKCTPSGSDGKG